MSTAAPTSGLVMTQDTHGSKRRNVGKRAGNVTMPDMSNRREEEKLTSPTINLVNN